MSDVLHARHVLPADDGHRIHAQIWQPERTATGIVQVLHGMGEYANRYERFAHAAAQRGYALCIHDHRGHGGHGGTAGHFGDDDGWQRLISDALVAHDFARERFPDTPISLFGHSMGSYIAQHFAMHYGNRLAALILSASTWRTRIGLVPAWLLARMEALRLGVRGNSPLLHKLGFGDFNRRFRPARTAFDWLSRDEAEVDRYAADPLCGGPYSCGLWLDLIGGLLEISSDHAITRVPADLPILITGGEADPVGGERGMTRLAMHYAQTGHQRISVKIYPDGRHEMLNETNRDEVTGNLLDWIAANAKKSRTPAASESRATSDSSRSG